MKLQLKGKLLASEVKTSGKTGQPYTLLLIRQGVEVCNLMLDRSCDINPVSFIDKDVCCEVAYNSRYRNLGSCLNIK